MEMIGQGWPLYAAVPARRKVYAIVGWVADGAGRLAPRGVELTAGSDTAPMAVALMRDGGLVRVLISADLREAQLAARGYGPGPEVPPGNSLGEQPHDGDGCHAEGRPHLGPCVDTRLPDETRPREARFREERLREVVRDLRDRLLSLAVSGFDVSHRDDLREQVLAAAASVGEGLP